MARPLTNDEKRQLEALIDSAGVTQLAFTIAEILTEKAEHLALVWQDHRSAAIYTEVATRAESFGRYAQERVV